MARFSDLSARIAPNPSLAVLNSLNLNRLEPGQFMSDKTPSTDFGSPTWHPPSLLMGGKIPSAANLEKLIDTLLLLLKEPESTAVLVQQDQRISPAYIYSRAKSVPKAQPCVFRGSCTRTPDMVEGCRCHHQPRRSNAGTSRMSGWFRREIQNPRALDDSGMNLEAQCGPPSLVSLMMQRGAERMLRITQNFQLQTVNPQNRLSSGNTLSLQSIVNAFGMFKRASSARERSLEVSCAAVHELRVQCRWGGIFRRGQTAGVRPNYIHGV
ncbi:hypothetical protein B0H12DRAFT_1127910 [Mycena haematopus]|nr:hypothetical protein B0H12DRAFT_1127910 [Mycena haematopus]